ncbi:hypothetical protein [Goodfellowiella coeruleoviolacea]|uniref:Uncharacterized protein n=1 Tax=Goodfellowiella coeruleoviolacea TaxID=334858 RepID=A0AAE3KHE0_9PSEU|nr:hypothetical protein [Goodfellowiella coeruleoviolacea]MCP2166777.1 hypothetical protein [Goodfellowiella coeruleoviolacea]
MNQPVVKLQGDATRVLAITGYLLVLVLLVVTQPVLIVPMLALPAIPQVRRWFFGQTVAVAATAPPPAPVLDIHRLAISGTPMRSSTEGCFFRFSCDVLWQSATAVGVGHARTGPTNPAAVAEHLIKQRAEAITSQSLLTDHEFVCSRLQAELSVVWSDPTNQVRAMAENVRLYVSPSELQIVKHHLDLRRKWADREDQRAWERSQRAYLTQDVLTSTASTMVWWLSRHPDQVEQTARLIGVFAQLSAAANGTEVEPMFQHLVPAGVDATGRPVYQLDQTEQTWEDHLAAVAAEVFPGADPTTQPLFGHHLARLLESAGREDMAALVRDHFGAPDLADGPPALTNGQPTPAEADPPGSEG